MTKELIERLYASDVASALTNEAARAIEALQARVAELEKVVTTLKGDLTQRTADLMLITAELVAIKDQEPVATLWRENNQKLYPGLLIDLTATGEALPTGVLHHLFAAPIPPVREPLSDNAILGIYNKVGQEDGAPYRFAGAIEALQARVAELEYLDTQRLSSLRQVEAERNAAQGVIETITKDQTWFELKAERDALAAKLAAALPYGPRPKFGAIGSRDVDVAEAQRAWDKAMAAQPAQMQINCDDCVYHYKDADQKPCAMCIHGTGLYDNFEPRIPAAQEVK